MSALVASKLTQSDQPFLDFARKVNRLLSESEGLDIGVAKKSCASCWLLAAVIKEEMNIDIRLPGTHSFYYPWLPPPHLPQNILLHLKDRLLERLVSMVNGSIIQSRTSTPARAIRGGARPYKQKEIDDLQALRGLKEGETIFHQSIME
ncbi:hypothetical protein CPB85DRAFT_1831 [Mucidula mucida]|nr:hypothetical protein CPB85DRAFT_1831 [Mucidula mucida]